MIQQNLKAELQSRKCKNICHSSERGTKSHLKKTQSHLKSHFPPEITLLKSLQNFQTPLKSNFLVTPGFELTFQSWIVKNTCEISLFLVSPKCTAWLSLRDRKCGYCTRDLETKAWRPAPKHGNQVCRLLHLQVYQWHTVVITQLVL